MKIRCIMLISIVLMWPLAANAQPPQISDIKFQDGPSVGNLNNIAEVKVPEEYVFAGANDARVLMELMKNPTSGLEVGFVAPANLEWCVLFEFEDIGYVKDDEKDSLDAKAMLDALKKGNEAGNKERRKRGWPALTVVGWEQPPQYNQLTHNLEWATKIRDEKGDLTINYNTRLLGRSGVMQVTLITDSSALKSVLPVFQDILAGFDFKPGKKYAEYQRGDKLSEYGLSALVVGGATAVAVKSGLFKWLWKLIVVAVVAIGAFFKKIFSKGKAE